MQAFLPKNRRPKFEFQLKILDLNNVPLVSGTSYIKWHLPSSTSAEHRGRTAKEPIKEHKVIWDYAKTLPVRLAIDRNGILQECEIHFEVLQEYSSGTKGGRIALLGNVKLNLAEYVEGGGGGGGGGGGEVDGGGEEGITRRYLMQESKINSTLKITIVMKQVEGDKNFVCAPLRSAPVFGGIAGIMAGEQGEQGDDLGRLPSMSNKSRENGEIQDLYRRTLAASWSSQSGHLAADACIEDIFAGGNGWGTSFTNTTSTTTTTTNHAADGSSVGGHRYNISASPRDESDDGGGARTDGSRRHRGFAAFRRRTPKEPRSAAVRPSSPVVGAGQAGGGGHVRMGSLDGGRGSLGEQALRLAGGETDRERRGGGYSSGAHEIDELTAREDLRSWKVAVR